MTTKTTETNTKTVGEIAPAGLAMTKTGGGIARGLSPSMPLGALPATARSGILGEQLEADVTKQLGEATTAFGDVIRSLGLGVASSQTALDQGVIAMVNELRNTEVEVVTDVIETLDDDGLPDPDKTTLVTKKLSILNFMSPTVHEWKWMNLSMDFEVGEIDRDTGVRFHRNQKTSRESGGLWGFIGWYSGSTRTDDTETKSMTESERGWSSGQVRVDALMAPRRTGKFPVPTDISKGPQIYISQGAIKEVDVSGVPAREMELIVRLRKMDGSANPGKSLEVDAGNLLVSYLTGAGYTGSTTNTDGEIKVKVQRLTPNALSLRAQRVLVRVQLGQMSQTREILI